MTAWGLGFDLGEEGEAASPGVLIIPGVVLQAPHEVRQHVRSHIGIAGVVDIGMDGTPEDWLGTGGDVLIDWEGSDHVTTVSVSLNIEPHGHGLTHLNVQLVEGFAEDVSLLLPLVEILNLKPVTTNKVKIVKYCLMIFNNLKFLSPGHDSMLGEGPVAELSS